MWDYLNRMLASGFNNSTTTYAYDPSGARVLQTSTTSTTYYPNKSFSPTSTKAGSNTYATSTNYIWNGDTLLATIDQPMYQRHRNRHADHAIHPSRSFREHQRGYRPKRQPGAAHGLLPVWRDAGVDEHVSDEREAAIYRAIRRCADKSQII